MIENVIHIKKISLDRVTCTKYKVNRHLSGMWTVYCITARAYTCNNG